MVFSSNIFLFLFLPAYLAVYYATPAKHRSLTILLGSYVFYGWWRIDFLLLFAAVTVWNFVFSKLILRGDGQDNSKAKFWMLLGVAGNILTLATFKYFNFGVDTMNTLLGRSGENTMDALSFILPIGISFYIFQSISFLVDVYRKDAPPPRSFIEFAAFISLFPQLIAGPVLRYKDLAPQFASRIHSWALFSKGAYRFMLGFCKKILVADAIAPLVESVFALENPTMAESWLGALAYTVQLYFDFSAYSDMAIGLGMMMGFKFMENFNAPYISRSITEFWRRWHISLSTWLKDYLYIPLGGNRKGKRRTYINLMLTMVLGGLWHGANWTFVLWGLIHGAALCSERLVGYGKNHNAFKSSHVIPMAFTFLIVVISWVVFRADTFSHALDLYGAMVGWNGIPISPALEWQIQGFSITALIIGLTLIFTVPVYEHVKGVKIRDNEGKAMHIAIAALFLIAVTRLSAQSYSPFLYFQF